METDDSAFVLNIDDVIDVLRSAARSVGMRGEIGYLQFSGGLWYEAWVFHENYREGDLFLSVRLDRGQPVSVGVARFCEDCPDLVGNQSCLVNDLQALHDWSVKYLQEYVKRQVHADQADTH